MRVVDAIFLEIVLTLFCDQIPLSLFGLIFFLKYVKSQESKVRSFLIVSAAQFCLDSIIIDVVALENLLEGFFCGFFPVATSVLSIDESIIISSGVSGRYYSL